MIIRLIMAASLAVTLVSSTAVGETYTFEERYARFNLFADCGPMGLIVKGLSEDAKKNRPYQGIDSSRWREPPEGRPSL